MSGSAALRLLLLSTSTVHGSGYLEYAKDAVAGFLDGVSRLLFVPYALADHEVYTARVAAALRPLGIKVSGLQEYVDPAAAVNDAGAVFVGGGNTFRLLDNMQRRGLIEPLRTRVRAGELRYMGSSAGTNLACPTIRTTNDMPIVQPASFEALDLVPFQINPHYLDPDPGSTHMGETRETRIREFHEENATPVLGVREGAWLDVADGSATLRGGQGARLFVRGEEPRELDAGADLTFLLG